MPSQKKGTKKRRMDAFGLKSFDPHLLKEKQNQSQQLHGWLKAITLIKRLRVMQIVFAKLAARWIWAKYSTKKKIPAGDCDHSKSSVDIWHLIILQYIFYFQFVLKCSPQKVKLPDAVCVCRKSSLLMIVNDCWHGFVYVINGTEWRRSLPCQWPEALH